MRRTAVFLAALLCAGAADAGGRTSAIFLQRTLGARAAGLGNAFVAAKYSADSLQYNPAALATVKGKTLSSTYLNAYGAVNYGSLGYAQPLGYGVAGISAVYFNAGPLDLNLSNGATGTVTAEEDLAAAATYAIGLPLGFSVGATYRFVRMELAETASATTHQGDFGLHWRTPIHGVSLGAAYQYIGPDITFESAGDPPPRTLRYGVAFQFPDFDIKKLDPGVDVQAFDAMVTADLVQTLHEEPSPRAGLEMGITPHSLNRVALRLGWVFGRSAEGPTFGFGYLGKRFGVDYAFGSTGDLGGLQHLTFSFHF